MPETALDAKHGSAAIALQLVTILATILVRIVAIESYYNDQHRIDEMFRGR